MRRSFLIGCLILVALACAADHTMQFVARRYPRGAVSGSVSDHRSSTS